MPPPENFLRFLMPNCAFGGGQFWPENKLIEGQPNGYDVICRNASLLAFHLWPTIFAGAPFRLQNISRNGVPPRSRTTTPLHVGLHAFKFSTKTRLTMPAAQSTTVHDGLLHPHPRHCSSPASAVRRLPSAVRTATPAFHVRSSGIFCGRPGGLELVTRLAVRDPSRSSDSFRRDLKILSSFY